MRDSEVLDIQVLRRSRHMIANVLEETETTNSVPYSFIIAKLKNVVCSSKWLSACLGVESRDGVK